ncbi:MAG TPA: hypothetical protein VGW40_12930 [Allosphingosinicella sp.]|nr:hypothetical protein [Allosphingosinicella sp.]
MPATCLAPLAPEPAAPPPADGSRGLWVGPIHLCRDTAESAVADSEDRGPFPSLIVTLRPELRAELERESGRLVGGAMPIRLDGKLISEPVVREPLTGGVLALSGQSAEETQAIEAAIRQPC